MLTYCSSPRLSGIARVASILALAAAPLFPASNQGITYLALGDSVAFGLDVRLLANNPPPTPSDFTGYPEVVAAFENLLKPTKEINTACPGETSGSFITGTGPDFGCYSNGPQGQPPFKSSVGLQHELYTTTVDLCPVRARFE